MDIEEIHEWRGCFFLFRLGFCEIAVVSGRLSPPISIITKRIPNVHDAASRCWMLRRETMVVPKMKVVKYLTLNPLVVIQMQGLGEAARGASKGPFIVT